jgi:hypothetical protein
MYLNRYLLELKKYLPKHDAHIMYDQFEELKRAVHAPFELPATSDSMISKKRTKDTLKRFVVSFPNNRI